MPKSATFDRSDGASFVCLVLEGPAEFRTNSLT